MSIVTDAHVRVRPIAARYLVQTHNSNGNEKSAQRDANTARWL